MSKVLLGWVPSNSGTAVDGYIPFCNPSHHGAVRQLWERMKWGLLRGAHGDTLWEYNPRDMSLIRRRNTNLVGESMHGFLAPIGQMVVNDREKLEALLAQCTPEMIAEDVREVVNRNRAELRNVLVHDRSARSMVDIVATITCRVDGVCCSNDRVAGGDFVRRFVKDLSECSIAWRDRRLHVAVSGVPATHPMCDWTAKNEERVNKVRASIAAMLSD